MKLLHFISKINTHLLFIFVFIYIQNSAINFLFNINMINNIFLAIIYFCISLFVTKKYLDISSPYRKYL